MQAFSAGHSSGFFLSLIQDCFRQQTFQQTTGSALGFTRIPFSINAHAKTIATINTKNSDHAGREVRIIPLTNGLNAAPNHPSDCAEK